MWQNAGNNNTEDINVADSQH